MEGDNQETTKEKEALRPVETVPDDLVEIDPAEFFDPEEFGIRRGFVMPGHLGRNASRKVGGDDEDRT